MYRLVGGLGAFMPRKLRDGVEALDVFDCNGYAGCLAELVMGDYRRLGPRVRLTSLMII
jgi:hypothetical protein